MTTEQGFLIGVDLGGTKIESALLDSHGKFVARVRKATPRAYDETLAAIKDTIEQACAGHAAADIPVGVGIPGSPSPSTGLIRNANSTWLNGRPLQTDLEKVLGRPVRLANDANCFALSEARDGAAAGAKVVFGVILGTGCGGGLVIDGALLEGAAGVTGEWGHISLPWPSVQETEEAAPCWCGKRGCLETWISGPGYARWASAAFGEVLSPEMIVARAAAGDAVAAASLLVLQDRIARGLAIVINLVDPDVIVLGGGLSNLPGLGEGIESRLSAHVFSDVVNTRVVQNRFGDSSGVRGAAWLWATP
jgi:fructokinase